MAGRAAARIKKRQAWWAWRQWDVDSGTAGGVGWAAGTLLVEATTARANLDTWVGPVPELAIDERTPQNLPEAFGRVQKPLPRPRPRCRVTPLWPGRAADFSRIGADFLRVGCARRLVAMRASIIILRANLHCGRIEHARF